MVAARDSEVAARYNVAAVRDNVAAIRYGRGGGSIAWWRRAGLCAEVVVAKMEEGFGHEPTRLYLTVSINKAQLAETTADGLGHEPTRPGHCSTCSPSPWVRGLGIAQGPVLGLTRPAL